MNFWSAEETRKKMPSIKEYNKIFEKTFSEIELLIDTKARADCHECTYNIPLQVVDKITELLVEAGYHLKSNWDEANETTIETVIGW